MRNRTTKAIRDRASEEDTHWGIVGGCVTYFTIKDGKVFYNGKPWLHATVMKFYKL